MAATLGAALMALGMLSWPEWRTLYGILSIRTQCDGHDTTCHNLAKYIHVCIYIYILYIYVNAHIYNIYIYIYLYIYQ